MKKPTLIASKNMDAPWPASGGTTGIGDGAARGTAGRSAALLTNPVIASSDLDDHLKVAPVCPNSKNTKETRPVAIRLVLPKPFVSMPGDLSASRLNGMSEEPVKQHECPVSET